ncbi:MAG TPA: hypothetical protein VF644_10430 [Pyrinomonadaceae bacterium]|jgi:hypothetical protein
MKRAVFISLIFVFAVCSLPAYGSSFVHYSDEVKPKGLPNGALSVQAKLYFGDEDEESEAVEGVTFYLLSKSAAEILRSAKFEFDFADQLMTDESYLEAAANAFLPNNREDSEFVTALVGAELAKHQKAKIKTDAFGRASLRQIPAGNYYLFGMARSEETVLVWNLPVTIKSGSNILELDQHNAESVFTIED